MAISEHPAERHREVCRTFSDRVRGTRSWDAPSPVAGWTARDVVRHLTEWFSAFLPLLGGLAVGCATNVLQGVLPDALQAFANSGSVWVVAAFVAGAVVGTSGWRACAAGSATQVGAVVGYYAYAEFVRDGMGGLAWPLFWLALALVAGPIFGTAGAWWRTGQGRRRLAGPAVLGAVFGMDALHYLIVLHYYDNAIGYAVIGLLIPLLLGRSTRGRLIGLGCAAVLAIVAVGVLNTLASLMGGSS